MPQDPWVSATNVPLTQDQLRNYNFQDESLKFVYLLDDSLICFIDSHFSYRFLILLDQDRVGTVPFGRKLHDMECAKIHAFSHSVLCFGKGAMNDASDKFTKRWTEHFANKPVMDTQFQRWCQSCIASAFEATPSLVRFIFHAVPGATTSEIRK